MLMKPYMLWDSTNGLSLEERFLTPQTYVKSLLDITVVSAQVVKGRDGCAVLYLIF
jgi:hypothetical protein